MFSPFLFNFLCIPPICFDHIDVFSFSFFFHFSNISFSWKFCSFEIWVLFCLSVCLVECMCCEPYLTVDSILGIFQEYDSAIMGVS